MNFNSFVEIDSDDDMGLASFCWISIRCIWQSSILALVVLYFYISRTIDDDDVVQLDFRFVWRQRRINNNKKSILCPQQPNLEMKNNKIKVKFWQHTMNNILLLLFIVCGAYEFSMSCQTTLFLLNNRKRDIKLKTNKQKINRNIKPSHLTTTKFSVVHCKCEECHRQSVKSWMPIDWLVAIAIMAQQQTYWVLEYMSLWTDICTTHTHTHLMSYAITYR